MTSPLTLLSIDVLGEITDLVEAADIAILWMCGSRTLNYKLGVGGGVRQFSHRTHALRMSWPTLVSSFHHLRTFRLVYIHVGECTKIANANFDTLPPTVECIETAFFDDVVKLHALLVASPNRLPRLHTVILAGHTQQLQTELIRALPASLHTISFLASEACVKDSIPLSLNDLPPGITHLSSYETCLTMGSDGAANEEARQTSGLQTYSTGSDSGEWMRALPPHLRTLELEIMNDEHLDLLPSTLTHLDVTDIGASRLFYASLPPTLTELRVDNHVNGDALEIDAAIARVLPRTLTRLLGASIDPLAIPYLPPGMTELFVFTSTRWHVDLTCAIPTACTRLTISAMTVLSMAKLPATLLHLQVFASIPAEAMRLLPPSLISLCMAGSSNTETIDYFSLLPPRLEELDMLYGYHDVSNCDTTMLPRTLKRLNISHHNVNPPHSWYTGLPSSLVHVRLVVRAFNITHATSIAHLANLEHLSLQVDEWNPHVIAHLPPQLHNLVVYTSNKHRDKALSRPVVNNLLAALPRQLVICHIPSLRPLNATMRRHLPRTLVSLLVNSVDVIEKWRTLRAHGLREVR